MRQTCLLCMVVVSAVNYPLRPICPALRHRGWASVECLAALTLPSPIWIFLELVAVPRLRRWRGWAVERVRNFPRWVCSTVFSAATVTLNRIVANTHDAAA